MKKAGALPIAIHAKAGFQFFELIDVALAGRVGVPDFMIVGYGLSTDGWLDPIAFLKAHGADTNPAPFGPAKRRRNSTHCTRASIE